MKRWTVFFQQRGKRTESLAKRRFAAPNWWSSWKGLRWSIARATSEIPLSFLPLANFTCSADWLHIWKLPKTVCSRKRCFVDLIELSTCLFKFYNLADCKTKKINKSSILINYLILLNFLITKEYILNYP